MTTPIASRTNVASVILDDEFEDIKQVLKDTAKPLRKHQLKRKTL